MNWRVSVNLSNIRFLGPHFCCRKSPFGPHFTQNQVPILTNLGPHSMWEQWTKWGSFQQFGPHDYILNSESLYGKGFFPL